MPKRVLRAPVLYATSPSQGWEVSRRTAYHPTTRSLLYPFTPIKTSGFLNPWLVSVPLPSASCLQTSGQA